MKENQTQLQTMEDDNTTPIPYLFLTQIGYDLFVIFRVNGSITNDRPLVKWFPMFEKRTLDLIAFRYIFSCDKIEILLAYYPREDRPNWVSITPSMVAAALQNQKDVFKLVLVISQTADRETFPTNAFVDYYRSPPWQSSTSS